MGGSRRETEGENNGKGEKGDMVRVEYNGKIPGGRSEWRVEGRWERRVDVWREGEG